jgi:hypothetical protein
MTTPLKARTLGIDIDIADTPEADADRLIASFRVRAYSEARQRQRRAESSEAASHWSQVSNLIARRAEELDAHEPTTGSETDLGATFGGNALGARPAVRFFEDDPVDALERALGGRPQRFRLQFFGVDADLGPALIIETEMQAYDASSAIRKALGADWPARLEPAPPRSRRA